MPATSVTPDGIANSNRIKQSSNVVLHRKVVDQILTAKRYPMRLLRMGKPFVGASLEVDFMIAESDQGQFYSGLETLNSQAEDNVVTGAYNHTAFSQPVVSIMLESFANADSEAKLIDLDMIQRDKAVANAAHKFAQALWGLGTGAMPLGIQAFADDGTNKATIAGLSRSTYPALAGYYAAASGGALSLAGMAAADDATSDDDMEGEMPNVIVTGKTVWALFERLVDPKVRIEYNRGGGLVVPLSGNEVRPRGEIGAGVGFTALSFRGVPVIKDGSTPSGKMFFINENYLYWAGRTTVPADYKEDIMKVSLGKAKTLEGVAAQLTPPSDAGWFVQDSKMMPYQAGRIGRYHVIGQMICTQFRRQGQIHTITTI